MPPKKQPVKPSATLSQAQEEEMSSALIAKLLAQDAMNDGGGNYYAEYSNDTRHYDSYQGRVEDQDGNYEDDESDDYAPKRQGKSKKVKTRKSESAQPRGSKRKKAPVDNDNSATTTADTSTDPSQPLEATTNNSTTNGNGEKPAKVKKVKKPLPPGFNTGVYTEGEEVLFLEGLNLYGRGWNDLSRHMGTRDPHSIRSHAQKHFIKLYRDNQPLPDKVKESGDGFTLSGKPLDPDSAAARSYLGRASHGNNNPRTTTTVTPTNGSTRTVLSTPPAPTGEPSQSENCAPMDTTTESVRMAEKTMTALTIGNSNTELTNEQQQPSPPSSSSPKSKKKQPRQQKTIIDSPEATYEGNGRTNYASSRLRRPRSSNSINFRQLGQDDDPLTMVKCEPFVGKPGSNTTGAQPFEMTVHSNVLLMMDFHAHLMTTEIIGFLAGEWDKTTRRIMVKEAYPCRSLNTGQNDVNVEMDPTSALETRHLIEEKNMAVVGWYHSHPTFIPDPSLVDIENQCNYQKLCRDECHTPTTTESTFTVEPFVGAIVGPYDPMLPASASVINWFHVGNDWNEGRIPKRLVYDLHEDTTLSHDEEGRMFKLPVEYKSSPEKVNFAEYWRHDGQETKLEKLIKSLAARMPWIQQKMALLRQQQETGVDVVMDGQSTPGVIDTFLEKVQETLKGW